MGDMKGGEKDFMLAMDLQKKTQYEPIDENTVASNNSKNRDKQPMSGLSLIKILISSIKYW